MNKYLKFAPVVLSAFALTFTSCSDDDDDPKPVIDPVVSPVENVFDKGVPAKVGGNTITVNDKGQVTKIANEDEDITFEYGSFSRAGNFQVKMTIAPSSPYDSEEVFYLRLNTMGFVDYAVEVEDGDEDGEYWFEYNKDGQMTKMRRSENNETYVMTYKDGDIIKAVGTEDGDDDEVYTFTYTNDQYKAPVANAGCVMLYEDAFHIQVDNIEPAYYAGLLGKATKHLPMGYVEKSGNETESGVYKWTFNADNLPVKFEAVEEYYSTIVEFTW